jgi:hypothetical protein
MFGKTSEPFVVDAAPIGFWPQEALLDLVSVRLTILCAARTTDTSEDLVQVGRVELVSKRVAVRPWRAALT